MCVLTKINTTTKGSVIKVQIVSNMNNNGKAIDLKRSSVETN